jgi:peptidyl-prolyl cis-trans isomerase B (cyclophilin B)
MQKQFSLTLLFLLTCLPVTSWAGSFVVAPEATDSVATTDSVETRTLVRFETTSGNFTIALFNDTPIHRDNFIKLVNEQFYDSLLFHRTIWEFMIQTGDPTSKTAKPGEKLGEGSVGYTLPAEIHYPKYFHRRGMVAAAREGDKENPEWRSDGSQFYIVWGKTYGGGMMERIRQRVRNNTNPPIELALEHEDTYWEVGGAPHLDGQYTIFGEVIDGLQTIDEIQLAETDENDRPFYDFRIIKAYILKE